MPAFICTTCGTQYAPSEKPPAACPICDDERQYVHAAGPELDHARHARQAQHERLARA